MATTVRVNEPSHYEHCRPVPVEEPKSCWAVICDAWKKTYSPSVLTLLIFLLATAIIIVAMIFDDITIPRLLTGIVGLLVYIVTIPSIWMDFRRDCEPQPDRNQELLLTQVKKVLFAKVRYHSIITWLAIVMVISTPICDDDVLFFMLLVDCGLMIAVVVLGVNTTQNGPLGVRV
ncbi:hypothetical protein GCK72_008903 [Caenorhabditis remanei]|uniref:Uncharacterized protein n=1 Tax=Caenorhabditis remanei TaxID=31234 RepID=A0A6A5H1K6_CAERE|nr:hypothetical protein GCK72_008903 [Caenorhabditis remanei]KAF1760654.1 hypothetical protein GCK72_008903 [Caenorhabditis remanei]